MIYNKKIVLMYHDIYNKNTNDSGFINLSSEKYKIPVYDFINHLYYYQNSNNIELTFDDGGCSAINIIAPLLKIFSIKAVFFIVTSKIDKDGFLKREDIIKLLNDGHKIGLHSHTHPRNMNQLSYDEVYKEWKKSRDILSNIVNSNVIYASAPNGYFSNIDIEILEKLGINYFYTSNVKTKNFKIDKINIIDRIVIKKSTSQFAIKNLIKYYDKSYYYNMIKIYKTITGKI